MIDKKVITGVVATLGASLCCITPVLAVLAGSTGMASTFSWMEPFRPYLIALTIIVLVYAWWDKLKPKKEDIECACEPDEDGKVSFWHTKIFLAIITLFSVVMLSFPYWGGELIRDDKPIVVVAKANLLKKVINIEGMTCEACEVTVEKIGGEVKGVSYIKASVDKKTAVVEYDKQKTDIKSIMNAIGTTGYKPVSYEDSLGLHKVNDIKIVPHKELGNSSKCGGNKCGAKKCGLGKCGSSK